MKILFSALAACTLCVLFAFSSKINSPDISMGKMVKQTIQYKNGTTATRFLSSIDIKNLDSSKEDTEVGNCTISTPSGGCSTTAKTCSEALGGFARCLCASGTTSWCVTAPTGPGSED
jgi:hypothetical protein